jgi:hypothetical protein
LASAWRCKGRAEVSELMRMCEKERRGDDEWSGSESPINDKCTYEAVMATWATGNRDLSEKVVYDEGVKGSDCDGL